MVRKATQRVQPIYLSDCEAIVIDDGMVHYTRRDDDGRSHDIVVTAADLRTSLQAATGQSVYDDDDIKRLLRGVS